MYLTEDPRMARTKRLIAGAAGDTGRIAMEALIRRAFAIRALVPKEDDRPSSLSCGSTTA